MMDSKRERFELVDRRPLSASSCACSRFQRERISGTKGKDGVLLEDSWWLNTETKGLFTEIVESSTCVWDGIWGFSVNGN